MADYQIVVFNELTGHQQLVDELNMDDITSLPAVLDGKESAGAAAAAISAAAADATAKANAAASGAASALASHEADTSVHGIANTANLYAAGGTDVAIADGGTGASTAADARANLGLGTLATQSGTFSGTSSGTNTGDQTLAGLGAAPATVEYLVGTASAGLSAEIVVGTSPGGELGGTWAAPTVDATHSGSTHAATQAAAEATAAGALSTHVAASDPHLGYLTPAEGAAAYDAIGAAAAVTTTSIGAVPTARTITAGTGLTGGGDLSANRSLALADPVQGAYAPGSFTIAAGRYAVMSNHLILTGTQQVVLAGTTRLRIS